MTNLKPNKILTIKAWFVYILERKNRKFGENALKLVLEIPNALSQRKSTFRDMTWIVAGKTWYYVEYFM